MEEKKEWKRPQDVVSFRTSDPKEMLGKYMPKHAVKTWTEDFRDEDTGDVVSIERNQIVVERGYISQEKLAEIQFAIQAGDIEDVEVCDDDIQPMSVQTANYLIPYNLEMQRWAGMDVVKDRFACYAHDINQAIRIATEFGQMYRGFAGDIKVNRVVRMDAELVPDNHQCIPEDDRTPAYERKDYFKVTLRCEYPDGNLKMKHYDKHFIVHAKDVGEAKERIALLIEINKKNGQWVEEEDSRTTIRKAVPFEVDCIVPREFSELYAED